VLGGWGLPLVSAGRRVSPRELTLSLQLHVRPLHDAKVWIAREHLGPLCHALQYLGLDGLMCVPVIREPQHGVCEASRCKLLVHLVAAVLAESVGELQRVQLHVCIAVRQSLDHGSNSIFGACVGRAYFVAYILRLLGQHIFF
jgi:hypothetical protein